MHSIEYSLLLFIEQVDIFIHFSSFSISSIIFFLYSLIEKGVTKIPFLSSSIISEQLEKLLNAIGTTPYDIASTKTNPNPSNAEAIQKIFALS